MSKLSVHLVAWNGAKYIPYLFESLRKQTYKDWELLAIDNASQKDNTADLIEKELQNFPVPARLIRNKENNGFAGGHNQAIEFTVHSSRFTEYFQLLNQDMYLAPDYFEKVVKMMDAHPDAGAGQGMLLRWEFNRVHSSQPALPAGRFTVHSDSLAEVIDTMGLKVMRSRRVVDWRTGERIPSPDLASARSPSPRGRGEGEGSIIEVFGVSGALPIYRRKAVEDVAFEGYMFDDGFGSYKEDVDLAFRLRSAGWKSYVETNARAWHDRTAAGPRETSDQAALKNRKGRAAYVNYYSYRNHFVILLKNEHCANFVKDWPWIVWYEFRKFTYLFFTDWATLKGLNDIWRLRAQIKKKRNYIMAHYKIKPEEMRRWFL